LSVLLFCASVCKTSYTVTMQHLIFSILSLSLIACRPPQAPETLDDLSSFLYEHTWDDDEEYLLVGLTNLEVWLQGHMSELGEVTNLSQEAVSSLEGDDRDVTGLIGAAVGYDVEFPVEDIILAVTYDDPTTMYPELYDYYDRTFIQGEDCFATRECNHIEFDVHSKQYLPLGIELEATFRTQYHWVETEFGLAAVQRVWTREPPIINKDWLTVDQEYFLSVTMPLANGRSRRVASMWVIAEMGNLDVPEGMALSITIDSMLETQDHLNEYLGSK
jgi:hypothetical protein